MPRFTNSLTGVVVNVDEATASQMGSDWAPSAGKAEPRKPTSRKSRTKNN